MAYTLIDTSPIQIQKNAAGNSASGYYLKLYAAGTTTPISMYTTSIGGGALAKCQIDSEGFAINGSGDVFIPYVDQTYKMVVYTNSTDADANTFASAFYIVDSIPQVSGSPGYGDKPYDMTLAEFKASTILVAGDVVVFSDRASATFDIASGVSGANTYDVIANTAATFKATLRTNGEVLLKALGADGTGATSITALVEAAIDITGIKKLLGTPGETYLVDSTIDMDVAGVLLDLNGAKLKEHTTFTGSSLLYLTKENCGVINGELQGSSVLAAATTGIDTSFAALTPKSKSRFENLKIYDMGNSGIRIQSGKKDQVHNITCTNNHISSGSSDGGNLALSLCDGVQSSNLHVYESYGKGLSYSGSINCTHTGLIVTRETYDTNGESGIYSSSGINNKITNVLTKNVYNKLSQHSDNIDITNFTMITDTYRVFQLQGASNCKLTNGKLVTTGANQGLYMDRHPDDGSGTSDCVGNIFTNVSVTTSVDIPLVLDGNTSGNKFIDCTLTTIAPDLTGSATDYVVSDAGTGNIFIRTKIRDTNSAGYGGIYHTSGANWEEYDCDINVPAAAVRAAAAGKVRGGDYTSTGGLSNVYLAAGALDMSGATLLLNGSDSAVGALQINAAGNKIRYCNIRCVTDTVAGYGILFGGAAVESTDILFSSVYGGSRSIKSITQSTTNRIKFVDLMGGTTDNGVNGTTAPGAHYSFSVD